MTVIQHEELACDCGSTQFLAVTTLRHSLNGGTTSTPAGYQCQQCHAVVDIGYLVKRVKAKHLRQQMAQMAEELGDTVVTTKPAGAPS